MSGCVTSGPDLVNAPAITALVAQTPLLFKNHRMPASAFGIGGA